MLFSSLICDFVMPNWCSNKLFVKNLKTEDQDLLLRLFDQETFCESILPQPDWANTPNEKGELPVPDEEHPELGRRFPDGTQDDRWYSWRNENWGTKWGECDVSNPVVGSDGSFSVSYLTAWAPLNENFFKAFSQRFPGARIAANYQESDRLLGHGCPGRHRQRPHRLFFRPHLPVDA